MGIEDVGVRFVTEGATQFEATLKRADNAVDNFGKTATKSADQVQSKWSKMMGVLSSPEGINFMKGMAASAAGALVAVGVGIKKLADEYMNYAFQVKDFGRIIGATPEQASRLIQVADDVRLSVGSLTIAMRQAINKGYTPTIEGLGQIADAYLAIQDPIERSKFLISTFGRSGLEMAKLMEKGSAGIRAMSAAIEDGLIVDQKGIDQAQAYYEALDQLNDRLTALRLMAGPIVIPIAISGIERVTDILSGIAPLMKMLSAMQLAMEQRVTTGGEVAKMFASYMTAEQSAEQITQNLTTKIIAQNNAVWQSSLLGQQMRQGWIDAGVMMDRSRLIYQNTTTAIDETSDSVETLGTKADVSASDMARLAGETANIKSVEVALQFKAPDIASQMSNLMKSIDWKAAGGEALTTFMSGFAANVAPLTDAQKKEIAGKVGSVAIALDVKTGDISKWEGITKIKELSGMNTTDAQALIDKISGMTPPDITAYLNQIMQLASPDTTAAAATATDNLSTSIAGIGQSFTTNQTAIQGWSTELGNIKTNADGAVISQNFLNEKMIGTGFAVKQNIGDARDWTSEMENMATQADDAADYVNNVNFAIKAIPKKVTIDFYIVQHGTMPTVGSGGSNYKPGPNPGKHALGGPTYANTLYLVGERGPELFVPNVSGTIIPNNRTNSLLSNLITIIPMAAGGKMTGKQEKEHQQKVKARWQARRVSQGSDNSDEGEGGDGSGGIGSDVISALQARETIAWDMVRASVAEYNQLIKSGVSPAELTGKRALIEQSTKEAQALTTLRIEAERQKALMDTQDTTEGMEDTATWLQKLMDQFKDFFALLTSSAAQEALRTLNPLISQSPAPLAQGLAQIRHQIDRTRIGELFGNVSQLATPRYYSNQTQSTYNINVPINNPVVRSDADIRSLAYAVAKEISANVRA